MNLCSLQSRVSVGVTFTLSDRSISCTVCPCRCYISSCMVCSCSCAYGESSHLLEIWNYGGFFFICSFFLWPIFFIWGEGCLVTKTCFCVTDMIPWQNYLMSQGAHQWSVRNGVCDICLWLCGSIGGYMVMWLCFLSLLVCVVRWWVVILQLFMHHLARCHNEYSFPFSLLFRWAVFLQMSRSPASPADFLPMPYCHPLCQQAVAGRNDWGQYLHAACIGIVL